MENLPIATPITSQEFFLLMRLLQTVEGQRRLPDIAREPTTWQNIYGKLVHQCAQARASQRDRLSPETTKHYLVTVGNVGNVYDGADWAEAGRVYDEYVCQSDAGYGRAAGEDVALFVDGEIGQQHLGELSEPDPSDQDDAP